VISPRKSRRGFTLIEILIVVVIAALAAMIALPGFVRTLKGSQLRTASRSILTAHKFARSTSVLRQVPMAMLLDSNRGEIEVLALKSSPNADARSKFLDSRDTRGVDAGSGAVLEEAPTIETELVRELGRDIKIVQFNSERGGQEFQGVFWINYHPNGMSDGFRLVISDGSSRAEITSDAISGRVEAEFGGF